MIRSATEADLSRIAEILVFDKRINFRPIFRDDDYSFNTLQVLRVAEEYSAPDCLKQIHVWDDGIVKGLIRTEGTEIRELYVDHFFQSRGIGAELIEYAILTFGSDRLWAIEKNTRAVRFYERHGFRPSGKRKFEEGTTEYLIELSRDPEV